MKRELWLGLGIVLIFFVSAGFVSAEVLNVPGEYASIQQAIDAASDGDTVLVAPGIYVGYIDFSNKEIILKSTNGALETTLRCPGGCPLPIISDVYENPNDAKPSVLDGFTIKEGKGGIVIIGESRYGAGIYLHGSILTIKNSVFYRNHVRAPNNVCGYGGAIAIRGLSRPKIINTDFVENFASCLGESNYGGKGGAVHSELSYPIFENVRFIRNIGGFGGAYHDKVSHPVFFNTLFYDNRAKGAGGAYWSQYSNPKIINTDFVGNLATNPDHVDFSPGGVYLLGTYDTLIANSIIWGNTAASGGAPGLRIISTIVNLANVTIINSIIQNLTYTHDNGWLDNPDGMEINVLEEDPLFVDMLNNNFHLTSGSPAVDFGDTSIYSSSISSYDIFIIGGPKFDLDYNPRLVGFSNPITEEIPIDLGPYEFQKRNILRERLRFSPEDIREFNLIEFFKKLFGI